MMNVRFRPVAVIVSMRQGSPMARLIYLQPGEELPQLDDEQPFLTVEASDDGRFFGTGAAWKPNGDAVFYGSLAESDMSLEAAVTAALEWATKYNVPTIWVQTTP